MDIFNIQGLIADGKIVSMLDIDPTKAYIQIGVWQPGNRENGSGNANAYAPYVIPVSAFAASSYGLIQNNGNPLTPRNTLNFTGTGFTIIDIGGKTTINFTVPPPFNGNTLVTCITDIFVTNIHSCSPLHIQPTNTGDVHIVEAGGNISVGLGVTPNGGKLHVSNLGGSLGTGDLDTSPQVYIGRFETSTNNPVLMIRENEYVGIRIGTPERHLDVRGDIQTRRIQDATALITTVDSYSNYLQGAIWNGSTTENRFIRTQLLMTNTLLFRMQFSNQFGQMLMAIENTGNVGIGTVTAPTEKLHVGGNALIEGLAGVGNRSVGVDTNGKLIISSGFTGNTLLTCISDIYVSNIHSCSPLHIQPTNTGDVYISENGGNVGIGTITPTSKLHLYSPGFIPTQLTIGSGTNVASIRLDSFIDGYGTSGGSTIDFNSNGTQYGKITTISANTRFHINSLGGYTLLLQDGTTSNININAGYGVIFGNGTQNNFISTNAGDIGIGTNFLTPSARLHIQGVSSTSANFALKVDNLSSVIGLLFNVRNDGNVGIGNSNPLSKLSIGLLAGIGTSTPDAISLGGTFSNVAGQNLKFKIYDDGGNIGGFGVSSGQIDYVGWNTSVDHVWYAGTSRNMTLKGAGDLGIGISNPLARFHVQGINTGGTANLYITNSGTAVMFKVTNDGKLSAPNLPTSVAGLVAGDLWNNAGVVNIV